MSSPCVLRVLCGEQYQFTKLSYQVTKSAIVDPMVRRFFPLLLALVVAGAPTALAVCQADCATTHLPHAHEGANGHACHDDGTGSGAGMQGVPRPCSHSDELAATSGATAQASAASACVAVTTPGPLVVSRLALLTNWRFGEPNPHESVRLRLTVSLRI